MPTKAAVCRHEHTGLVGLFVHMDGHDNMVLVWFAWFLPCMVLVLHSPATLCAPCRQTFYLYKKKSNTSPPNTLPVLLCSFPLPPTTCLSLFSVLKLPLPLPPLYLSPSFWFMSTILLYFHFCINMQLCLAYIGFFYLPTAFLLV